MEVIKGRMYDYNNGRFLSVDPFIQSPTSTQSMNPYTYIFNNPLSGVDPSGYIPCRAGQKDQCNGEDKKKYNDDLRKDRKKRQNTYRGFSNFNGARSSGSNPNVGDLRSKDPSTINSEASKRFKEFVAGIDKTCKSGGGCPDHVAKFANSLANGTTKYPADSILLPESPDDNGVRVRVSPSTGLIYWETPRGEVSVQGIKQFLDDGVKNGVVFVALSSLGMIGRSGGAIPPKYTPIPPKVGSTGGPGAGKNFSIKIQDAARAESGNTCVFCGVRTIRNKTPHPQRSNIDHATPKSRNGNNTLDNAQNTCQTCNLDKGTLTTVEYLEKLYGGG